MLFMSIFTFPPEKRDAVIRRRTEKGAMSRGEILGEWINYWWRQSFWSG